MAGATPNPSRTLSWLQMVQDADPDWQKLNLRPKIYKFSNGREFVKDPAVYTD